MPATSPVTCGLRSRRRDPDPSSSEAVRACWRRCRGGALVALRRPPRPARRRSTSPAWPWRSPRDRPGGRTGTRSTAPWRDGGSALQPNPAVGGVDGGEILREALWEGMAMRMTATTTTFRTPISCGSSPQRGLRGAGDWIHTARRWADGLRAAFRHFLIRWTRGDPRVLDPFHGGEERDTGTRPSEAHDYRRCRAVPEHWAEVSDRQILLRLQNNRSSAGPAGTGGACVRRSGAYGRHGPGRPRPCSEAAMQAHLAAFWKDPPAGAVYRGGQRS